MAGDRRPFLIPAVLGTVSNPAWSAPPFLMALDPDDLHVILASPLMVLLAPVTIAPPHATGGLAAGAALALRRAVATSLPFAPFWPFAPADALTGAGGPIIAAPLLAAPVWAFLLLRTAIRPANITRM
jgi:hypothetical protein